jgi:hypothetical protein
VFGCILGGNGVGSYDFVGSIKIFPIYLFNLHLHPHFPLKQYQLSDTCTHAILRISRTMDPTRSFEHCTTPRTLSGVSPLFPLLPANPLLPRTEILSRALVLKLDLLAKIGRSSIRIITRGVASRVLRNENKELIVRHRQAELIVHVVVVLRRLEAGTAGAVEGCSRVDA